MIRIVTDSVASIPADMVEEEGIEVASLYVNKDGVEYVESEMDLDAFYADIYDMVDNIPTSSQPSQHALETRFEDIAAAGDELLGIFISTSLSGAYDGALRAAKAVKERYPNFSFALIDSTSCGFDEGWPVIDAARARNAGKSLQECVDDTLLGVESTRFLFTPETLRFLQKGGRIGGAAALLGSLIQLCPVLTVVDGTPESTAKVRTRKKALAEIVSILKRDMDQFGLKNIVVHYIGDKAPALKWANEVIEPLVGHAVRVLPVSPVVGLHVGPAVGIAYECFSALSGKVTGSLRSRVCMA